MARPFLCRSIQRGVFSIHMLSAIYFIKGIDPPAAIHYLTFIFIPLGGCFNAFVYFRPRYLIHKGANPDKSRIFCLKKTLHIDPHLNLLSSVTFGRLGTRTSVQYKDSERVDPSKHRLSTNVRIVKGWILANGRIAGIFQAQSFRKLMAIARIKKTFPVHSFETTGWRLSRVKTCIRFKVRRYAF